MHVTGFKCLNKHFMAKKKNKKKTIASTRKSKNELATLNLHSKPSENFFKKIFTKSKKKNKKSHNKSKKGKDLKQVQKVTKEESTKEPPKEHLKKEKKRLSPGQKQKIKGGLLALIGLFALSFIGYFLFGKLFRPQYLSELLPANNTIATFEINIDPNNAQPLKFYENFKKYPVYQLENIFSLIKIFGGLDYNTDLSGWLGRRAGIAFLTGLDSNNAAQLSRIYFIETKDLKKSQESLAAKSFVLSKYGNFDLYTNSLNQNITIAAINNYLVVAENQDNLKHLIDLFSKQPKLADDQNFRKTANNLPQNGLAFGYLNLEKLFSFLTSNNQFVAQKGQDFSALKPYLGIFNSTGISIIAQPNALFAQTYTSVNKSALSRQKFLTFNDKYRGDLLSLANPDTILFAGGHDLSKELTELESMFQSGNKSSSIVFQSVLNSQKERYLGKDIDLQNDLYPLLENEYLFTVDNNFEKPVFSFFLKLKDPKTDLPKLEKIVSAFIETSGIFSPKIQSVTLPDGTQGQEIVASPEEISRSDELYRTYNITNLKLGNTGWNIYYASLNDKAVFSTNLETLKIIIDRAEGKVVNNLTTSNFFNTSLKPLMKNSDEIINLKTGALTEVLNLNADKILAPYLLPFGDLTVAKNYFDDGISSIYLLEII